jgi:hypothetical protein
MSNQLNNPRAGLPEQVQKLLRKAEEVLGRIPAEHQESVVRELIAELNRKAEEYQKMTDRVPDAFKRIDKDLG